MSIIVQVTAIICITLIALAMIGSKNSKGDKEE